MQLKDCTLVKLMPKRQQNPNASIQIQKIRTQQRWTKNTSKHTIGIQQRLASEIHQTIIDLTQTMKTIQTEEYSSIFRPWLGENNIATFITNFTNKDNLMWKKTQDFQSMQKYNCEPTKLATNSQMMMQEEQANKQNLHCNKVMEQFHKQPKNFAIDKKKQEILRHQLKQANNQKMSSQDESSFKDQKKENFTNKRGPYKKYSESLKKEVVEMYFQGNYSLNKISKMFSIPIKNIKRWAICGTQRKSGAGRKKLDPQMEEIVYQRILDTYKPGDIVPQATIKQWALNQCKAEQFKASRGWVNKFIQRKKLTQRFIIS